MFCVTTIKMRLFFDRCPSSDDELAGLFVFGDLLMLLWKFLSFFRWEFIVLSQNLQRLFGWWISFNDRLIRKLRKNLWLLRGKTCKFWIMKTLNRSSIKFDSLLGFFQSLESRASLISSRNVHKFMKYLKCNFILSIIRLRAALYHIGGDRRI